MTLLASVIPPPPPVSVELPYRWWAFLSLHIFLKTPIFPVQSHYFCTAFISLISLLISVQPHYLWRPSLITVQSPYFCTTIHISKHPPDLLTASLFPKTILNSVQSVHSPFISRAPPDLRTPPSPLYIPLTSYVLRRSRSAEGKERTYVFEVNNRSFSQGTRVFFLIFFLAFLSPSKAYWLPSRLRAK